MQLPFFDKVYACWMGKNIGGTIGGPFEGKKEIFTKTLRHSNEELAPYPNVIDQYQFRKDTIAAALVENNIDMKDIAAVVGRGGLLRPIASGVYEVNENMVADLSSAKYGEHASNLGGIIANAMAKEIPGCRAFIADPVVVDELCDVARISGHPKFPRKSIFHALNQKAIAKQYAAEVGKKYSDLNLIVAHMGGGTSIGAHKKGQIVDVNDALNGDGPFSPERSGSLTALDVVKACFSGEYTFDEMKKLKELVVDGTDYIKIKSAILGGDALAGAFGDAADVDGNAEVESTDYIRVKAHFLGTYDLFA